MAYLNAGHDSRNSDLETMYYYRKHELHMPKAERSALLIKETHERLMQQNPVYARAFKRVEAEKQTVLQEKNITLITKVETFLKDHGPKSLLITAMAIMFIGGIALAVCYHYGYIVDPMLKFTLLT